MVNKETKKMFSESYSKLVFNVLNVGFTSKEDAVKATIQYLEDVKKGIKKPMCIASLEQAENDGLDLNMAIEYIKSL